jgi:hypothetical protein
MNPEAMIPGRKTALDPSVGFPLNQNFGSKLDIQPNVGLIKPILTQVSIPSFNPKFN